MKLSDLLGIVGIGSLVAILVYPIFAPIRPSHHRRTCRSDLRQITLVQGMYANDFDDRFTGRDDWIDASYPYAKNWTLFHCPQAPGNWGYAFNAALDRKRLPPDPAVFPLLYDSVNPAKNASDLFKSLPVPPRHGEQTYNLIGFADGHVKGITVRQAASLGLNE